jgi:hypothetical protein
VSNALIEISGKSAGRKKERCTNSK